MKPTTSITFVLSIITSASAFAVHDERGENIGLNELSERSKYQLGVNIMSNADCTGKQIGVRNHDEHSCNAGTSVSGAKGVKVKSDGTKKGVGCVTFFEDGACRRTDGGPQGEVVRQTHGDECIDLTSFSFHVGCIVLGSLSGACGITEANC